METVFSTGRWFWPGYLWTGFTERGGGGDGARREREKSKPGILDPFLSPISSITRVTVSFPASLYCF